MDREGIAQRTLRNIRRDREAHSGLMPANLITLAHFSVSSAISLPKSAGEPTIGEAPSSESRASILGSARAALISLLSRSTISAGVFLGAPMPYHALASKPGTVSLTVGTPFNISEGLLPVTAKGRSLPALTYSMDAGMVANIICTCPPSKSVNAG